MRVRFPIGEDWDTLWESHWPINRCTEAAHGIHLMRKTGALFQCENCYYWFDSEESVAFMAAAQRIADIVNDRHRQN